MVQVKFFGHFAEIMGERILWIKIGADDTIGCLLTELDRKSNGKFKEALINSVAGKIHPYIKILVNGRDITFLKNLETKLKDNDVIAIIPPIAGG
jgi:molybdopterin synthase sulfur carrier subunit